MVPVPDFAAHRQRLLDTLDEDEAVLVFGGPTTLRNGDADYRYRPDSDVYWLSGWEGPDVALFLRPGDEPFVVFCQPKNREREIWTGIRPGPEGAKENYAADIAFSMEELDRELPRLLQGVSCLHYTFARFPNYDQQLMAAIHSATRAARRNGLDIPETFKAPSRHFHELRLRKGPDEAEVLRRAAEISAAGHLEAMKRAAPGVNEYEVEAAMTNVFRQMGTTGCGYVPIVAGGANATILHYVTNRDPLKDGDLLLIDAGAEHCYYTGDITRTFPVNGTFSDIQRRTYEWVLKAQLAAIDTARPGRTINEVHDAAVRIITEGMLDLGLLEGDIEELIADGSFKKYYMHGTSHWLGLDVHDPGMMGRKGKSRELEPGLVLTVEPGLYVPADDEEAPEPLRGMGIRIEDDILVSVGDPEVLTAAVPKTVEELEAFCS
ncbi:MAG: M24 family metallopeptidase [Proteobacteria bacterium]|jgi:Xaa-Pro aminopeptidase|nr:M24 family metallopeptidase [Pseudomonadota bacterium]